MAWSKSARKAQSERIKAAIAKKNGGSKVHWTQTPAVRKKQSQRMKAQHANGSLKLAKEKNSGKIAQAQAPRKVKPDHVTFAFGFSQGWLYAYAESLGLPGRTLAERVGQLLLAAASR